MNSTTVSPVSVTPAMPFPDEDQEGTVIKDVLPPVDPKGDMTHVKDVFPSTVSPASPGSTQPDFTTKSSAAKVCMTLT